LSIAEVRRHRLFFLVLGLAGREGVPTPSIRTELEPHHRMLMINPTRHATASISVEELAALRASATPVRILDVRSDASFASSEYVAAGALRVSPDQAIQRMTDLAVPFDSWIVAFVLDRTRLPAPVRCANFSEQGGFRPRANWRLGRMASHRPADRSET
jgi:hypothetical protein